MDESFDVIVVGAGPAGSAAALVAARAGLKVLLLERGEYPGSKNVSGAVLYGSAILHNLIPNWWESAPVERYITRRSLAIMSPEASFSLDLHSTKFADPPFNGFSILRPKFDSWFAAKAETAGALLLNEVVVDDLIQDKGRIAGVRVRREDGDIRANIVIACDGANSLLARKAGLQHEFEMQDMALGVKEVIGLTTEAIQERFQLTGNEGAAHEYIGSITDGVYGGAFLYTNRASLSLGVITQLSSLIGHKKRAYDLLELFKSHPSIKAMIRGGSLREYSAHLIPEAGWRMIPHLSTGGMLVAGDAAALTLAAGLYFEGMNYAIQSGIAAAKTAIAAHEKGDFSAPTMTQYKDILDDLHVTADFRKYRRAPEFLYGERFQNHYPALLTDIAEQIFLADGQRKRKIFSIALAALSRSGVSLRHIIKDIITAGRIFGC